MSIDIEHYTSEARNNETIRIDSVSTIEMMRMINKEDAKIAYAIESELKVIAEVVDKAATRLESGGRLIYIGGGLSGRIGILDASEVAPSFGTPYEMVQGIIAGGNPAVYKVIPGVEDDTYEIERELKEKKISIKDVIIGITASGSTPYVLSGIEYANKIGALTVGLSNNINSAISRIAEICIEIEVGPEVLTGSTRMKCGTAQKMVANMISTGVMIKLGRVYQNLLAYVEISNEKLVERVKKVFMMATGLDEETASNYLDRADNNAAAAIVMWKLKIEKKEAEALLQKYKGNLKATINKNERRNRILL